MVTGAEYHIPQYFGSLALQAYESARAGGDSERYFPVVIRQLEKLAGVKVRADLEEE